MIKDLWKRPITKAREDRGATDPILVIASIAVTLVLLVGGSFAVSGIIANGHNLNARSDLDKLAVAETAFYAENDVFSAYDKTSNNKLEKSGVGFNPTDGGDLVAIAAAVSPAFPNGGWVAITKSAASAGGPFYIRTSERNATIEVNPAKTGLVVDAAGKTSSSKVKADLAALGVTVAQMITAAG